MTAIDTTQLEALANLTFADFKALHLQNQNRAEVYYTELRIQGQNSGITSIENYANIAFGVVQNSTTNGQMANYFTAAFAEVATPVVDFSPGSDARLLMQYTLMQEDLAARLNNINNLGGDGELDFSVTNTIHENALDAIGLGPEAFALYTPLSILAEHDPAKAQNYFEAAIDSTGFLDTVGQGLLLGFGADISSAQSLSDILKDYGDQAEWLAASLEAMEDWIDANSGNADAAIVADKINAFQAVLNLAGGSFYAVADWVDWVSTTTQSLVNEISDWYETTLVFFGVTLTGWWDPLVIDLDGDGVSADYISASGGNYTTYFDLDGDGFAQATSWHSDGFLVRDLNDNGRIDNGTEMFGDATTDGFSALAAHDSNSDGVIDANDAIWSDLEIWEDANLDGQTQSEELLSLASLNITGINLAATVIGSGTGTGLTHTGTVTTSSGTLEAGNYNFEIEATNTRYAQDYNFDVRAAFLPTMRGYNQMPDLHIALSLDNDETAPDSLMSLMTEIVSYSFTEIFENWSDVTDTIEAILFRWAGVDGVSPTSRGDFIEDARQLEFVEEYLGQGFVDRNEWGTDPGAVQAREFQEFWDATLFPRLSASVLMQSAASNLFTDTISYDFAGDILDIPGARTFDQDALDSLEDIATNLSTASERLDFWLDVSAFLRSITQHNGSGNDFGLDATGNSLFAAAISSSDSSLVLDSANHDPANGITSVEYRINNPLGETYEGNSSNNSQTGTLNADTMVGYAGADNYEGGAGNDFIYGHSLDNAGDDSANDFLSGGDGNDFLDGAGGNDTLIGGEGADHSVGGDGNDLIRDGWGNASIQDLAEGGTGDDTYEYIGWGNASVYINDSSGTDVLKMFSNGQLYSTDLVYTRVINDHIRITGLNSGGTVGINVTIADQLLDLGDADGRGVETVELYDTNLDLKNLLLNWSGSMNTIGSEQDDVIDGITFGSTVDNISTYGGNDTVDAGGGDDQVYGGNGNDTIYGGAGSDTLSGEDGDDIINGEDGNDSISGGNGNNKLYGGGGDDFLAGGSGDDELDGGADDDDLSGGAGDDIFYFSSGLDTIVDLSGTDRLIVGNALRPEDIDFSYNGNDLVLEATAVLSGTTTISQQSQSDAVIESIEFEDGFTIYPYPLIFELSSSDTSTETISGHVGGRVIFANGGTDIVNADGGNDTVSTGRGDDELYGEDGDDKLHAGSGNDLISGGAGNDTIWGGEGNDTLSFASVSAAITASLITGTATGEGTDTFQGIENLIGGSGDDALTGDATANTLSGGAGNDVIDGGAGDDTASYANATGSMTINLTSNSASGADGSDTFISIENAIGSDYYDTLVGGSGNNTMRGNGGIDIITGWAGADILYGGTGNDILYGDDTASSAAYVGAGDDTIYGDAGEDTIAGGAGNDTIYGGDDDDTIYGAAGDDTIHGDAGDDLIYGDYAVAGANDGSDVIYGGAGEDTIVGSGGDDQLHGGDDADTIHGGGGQDEIWGDGGNDIIYGNDDDDIIHGGDGEDIMYGGGGLDTIYGDGGNDQVNGQAVTDYIYGGEGHDWIWGYEADDVLYGGNGNDTIFGDDQYNTTGFVGAGDDEIHGEAGNDVLSGGDGNDTIHGGADSDTIWGGNGDDVLNGDAGLDLMYGQAGADTMRGGDGADTLLGGDGADTLYADEGIDKLWGQDGIDTFVFEGETAFDGRDLVGDFQAGETINIADVLSDYGYDSATHTLSDWVQITYAGNHSFLQVDRDGTGTSYSMTDLMYTENYNNLTISDLVTA